MHSLERFLAILGAAACLVITIVIWRSIDTYQSMWPLPGFYFIEMAALGVAAATAFIHGGEIGGVITWAAAGIFLAFSIVGAFSVGFFYLPMVVLFVCISISADVRNKDRIASHLAVYLVAGIAQGVLMFAIIRLLYPSPAF